MNQQNATVPNLFRSKSKANSKSGVVQEDVQLPVYPKDHPCCKNGQNGQNGQHSPNCQHGHNPNAVAKEGGKEEPNPKFIDLCLCCCLECICI